MYYAYIIQCKDGSLYTGITDNLERRLQEHKNKKGGHYTAAHPVEKMVYHEQHSTKGQALRREIEIKSWQRNKKLSLIIKKARRKRGPKD